MIALLTAAVTAAVLAAAPFSSSGYRESPRHPRVVLAPRAGPQATIAIHFHSGSVQDGTSSGLTRVSQYAMLVANRSGSYRSLMLDCFGAGASLEIQTGLRESAFVLTAPQRDFERLARELASMVLAPVLLPARFNEAVERTLHDAREPGHGRDLVSIIAAKVLDDPRYQNDPYGERGAIERISTEEVRAQLQGPLSPANATVVVTGDFVPESVRRWLHKLQGGRAQPQSRADLSTPFGVQVPATQEIFILAYKSSFQTAQQSAAARVLASMIEERVDRVFRDRGVGYSQWIIPFHSPWLDLMVIGLPAHQASDRPLGPDLEDQVIDVREGSFKDDELERNRAHVLAELDEIDRSAPLLAEALGVGEGEWFGPQVVDQVRSLSRQGVLDAAKQIFSEQASVRIFYSPKVLQQGTIKAAVRSTRGGRQ
jgi:predicted Zn-dependent peptidase